jgi:hypothetical protein
MLNDWVFFPPVLGIELRALHLLGKLSTLVLLLLVNFSERISS